MLPAPPPKLAALMTQYFKPSDSGQVFWQPVTPLWLKAVQQITIVGNQSVPNSRCDFVDQVGIPSLLAKRMAYKTHDMVVTSQMDLRPGRLFAVEAAINKLLLVVVSHVSIFK